MKKQWLPYLFLSILLLVLITLGIRLGSAELSLHDILGSLSGQEKDKAINFVVWELRIPRTLTALLAGCGLGISGLVMQTLFTNVLAGPYILGVSSGASLAVAASIIAGVSFGSLGLPIVATLGALGVAFVVLLASSLIRSSVTLLIVGIMVASFCSALVSVLEYFSEEHLLKSFLIWTMGDFSKLGLGDLGGLTIPVIVGVFICFILSKDLNALMMGFQNAYGKGINSLRSRMILLVTVSCITGVITAYCGPIAFIGLAVPNVVRFMVKTANHRRMIPLVVLTGACFGVLCDIVSRLPGDEHSLPVNVVSAILGAPIVITVLFKQQKYLAS